MQDDETKDAKLIRSGPEKVSDRLLEDIEYWQESQHLETVVGGCIISIVFSFIISKRYARNLRSSVSRVRDRAAPFGFPRLPESVLSQSSRCGGLLLGEGSETEVGLYDVHLGEELLSLFALD
jgi:hypothetical protein